MRRPVCLLPLPLLLLAGCAQLPALGNRPDSYTLQRESELSYLSGEDGKAEALLQALLKQSPNDAEGWFRLGNLYARSERPEQAIEAYQNALRLKPDQARAWHNLGLLRLRQSSAALLQAHTLAGDDEALRQKLHRMLELLRQAQSAEGQAQ